MEYTAKSDIYALGITFWEIFENNSRPFYHIEELWNSSNPIAVITQIHNNNLRPCFKLIEEENLIRQLIEGMWQTDPNKRTDLDFALSTLKLCSSLQAISNELYSL